MRSSILVCTALAAPGALLAQKRWQVEVPVRIGAYFPATSLGAVGPARGRMSSAAVFGAGLELRRRGRPFGLRLAFVNPLSAGARFTPTPQCTGACEPFRDPNPLFQGVAFDLTYRMRAGPFRVQWSAGPGLRAYAPPKHICLCDGPGPGEISPFEIDETRIVRHLGAELRLPLRPFDVGVQLEDYWGAFKRTGRQQHDLVLGLGIHFR